MEKNEPQPWEELYAAAVFETDPSKIADRVNTAQQDFAGDGMLCTSPRFATTAKDSASKMQSGR